MSTVIDGPASPNFTPVPLRSSISFDDLASIPGLSAMLIENLPHAPRGKSVSWGIPFEITNPLLVREGDAPLEQTFVQPVRARWLVFLHTTDVRPLEKNAAGFFPASPGSGRLNELAARYILRYQDGAEASAEIRQRHQVGMFNRRWGENCFQAVEHHKPFPVRASHEQLKQGWGRTQTRVSGWEYGPWVNWLWAWENPHPEKAIIGLRLEPGRGAVILSALSAVRSSHGDASDHPLRWRTRRKAVLFLPPGEPFQPDLDEDGLLRQIQLDLGQVISAQPRRVYPNATWETGSESYNNQTPRLSENEILIEYTSHPDACFHLAGGRVVPAAQVEASQTDPALAPLQFVQPAAQRVRLRVVEQNSAKPVAVKLHLHGEWGEYLAPVDRHRIINDAWFEDYSVDFLHAGKHPCTYIPGETMVDLPLGRVYVEISKGFEVRPLRKVIEITPQTEEIVLTVEKVLPWREAGWVTADTHVHFLSPVSALLEGAAEGVNIVNLLASQWGELMTNVGDFDGRTTWGSLEAGGGPEGNGEWMVRVGSENRQHVLGHISLLGYQGRLIAPMTTGGPDESAIGDPVEILLTEWARQCKAQGGLVVLPHFPGPRAENAASIIAGDVDALEMTSWDDLYSGIDPYSLSDYYRYLNCGYLVAAVGGTDKMWAGVPVGAVRTYAHLRPGEPFTYAAWMEAVRRAETFVTYGPLLDFAVNGQPMGSRIQLPKGGGTLDVAWQVATVTVPVSQVDLIVNGEVRQSAAVQGERAAGSWSLKVERSAWLALLVRGGYPDKPPMIAAHSSPVMVEVEGAQLLAAADAVTILEQIEGALAYLDTVATRPQERAYKRMRLVLQSAYRTLHNRLHQQGIYHPPLER